MGALAQTRVSVPHGIPSSLHAVAQLLNLHRFDDRDAGGQRRIGVLDHKHPDGGSALLRNDRISVTSTALIKPPTVIAFVDVAAARRAVRQWSEARALGQGAHHH